MRYGDRLVAAALPSGVGLGLAIVLFVMKAALPPSRIAYSAVFGLTLSLVVAIVAARSSRLRGEAGGIAAVALVWWVPPMLLCAGSALYTTISGSGPSAEEPQLAAAIIVFLLPVWMLVAPHFDVNILGRAASRIAPLVMVAGALLVIAALVRAISRPDPDAWLTRTSTVATLPVGGTLDVKGTALFHQRTVGPRPKPLTLRTLHNPGAQDNSPPVIEESCSVETVASNASKSYLLTSGCRTVELAHDPRTELWLLRSEGSEYAHERLIFRDGLNDRVHVTAASLAKGVSPPVGWTHGAAAGLVVALGTFLVSRKRAREARDVDGVDASHLGKGRVNLASGEIVDVPAAVHAPDGIIRVALTADAGSYRDAPAVGARYLGAGSVADVRDVLEARARSCALASVAIVMVTISPLVVAAACRLVL
jgi:hypothetical protein